MKKVLVYLVCSVITLNLQSQNLRKCGTMEVHNRNVQKDPSILKRQAEIEQFTAAYVKNHYSGKNQKTQNIITIPVVVHVMHNGEPIGVGPNISDAQILSQIDILNEDYRLLNSDSLPPTHPFWQYTADAEIEFCLAQQDPWGDPTTGIVRYNVGQDSISWDDLETWIKPATIWDRDYYLNIWTVNFYSDEGLLGYAQFPGEADSTDGVVIGYKFFGDNGSVVYPNDLGRTATHEVGHWLNLRHIWGDQACGDDFVSDTPEHEEANYGCPTFPHKPYNECLPGTQQYGEMYMNYMDYVDDDCMNMFTFGQKARMRAALAGPRSTLLASDGCSIPTKKQKSFIKSSFAIFPNPTQNTFQIKFNAINENADIYIYNSIGQIVYSQKTIKNSSIIDVSHLENGIYFVHIIAQGHRLGVQKLVID